jgi:hypothetical protein
MLDLIFVVTLLASIGFTIFFTNWCDKQLSK